MAAAGLAGGAVTMLDGSTVVLAPLLGALIGVALGMLGGGGSILTVPILVYVLGQDPHIAVPTSLVIVGVNALMGARLHYQTGHVRLKPALLFGATGMLAAFGGARLSQSLSGPVLLTLFALLMLLIAALMLRRTPQHGEATQSTQPIMWWRMLLGGMLVGFLTGFLGVGGGFLVVPALVILLGMEMPDAVGSSLVVIALNSGAGLLGHVLDSALPWAVIALFVVGGIVGVRWGARAARNLAAARLRQSFAVFVVALALVLLVINVPVLFDI